MDHIQKINSMKTILVTNTHSYNGSNSVAVDLAVVNARSGKSVVLVDADLRRPILHSLFQLPNIMGLSDILQNHHSPFAVMQYQDSISLSIITSGRFPDCYLDIFDPTIMRESLQELKETFDKVIIHGPPFFFQEATSLAAQVEGVVILIHPGYYRTETSRAIIEKFQRTGATMIGLVMREYLKNQIETSGFIGQIFANDEFVKLST